MPRRPAPARSRVFTTMLGVYALARLFPAEAAAGPIGAAMIVIGAVYARGGRRSPPRCARAR